MSSAEVEYIDACEVGKEAVWLRKLLSDFFGGPLGLIIIKCDNQTNIKMSEVSVFHGKTKNIN